jgi:hypothetical protein
MFGSADLVPLSSKYPTHLQSANETSECLTAVVCSQTHLTWALAGDLISALVFVKPALTQPSRLFPPALQKASRRSLSDKRDKTEEVSVDPHLPHLLLS